MALIPFIDASLLVREHDRVPHETVIEEDLARNRFGENRLFVYDETCDVSPQHP